MNVGYFLRRLVMLLASHSSAPRATRLTSKGRTSARSDKESPDFRGGYYYDEAGNLIKDIPPQSGDEDF